ncbi:hypothetical protein ACTID9_11160 [Brevibacillus fluminis]|uniref:hypothetical protein n=1 Tax=Brevibacillus fluminis TaxID=511487 RepID=UPI003F8A846B
MTIIILPARLTAPRAEQILPRVENEQVALEHVQQLLADRGVLIMGFHAEKKGNDAAEIQVEIA